MNNAAAAITPDPGGRLVESTLLGSLTLPESQVFRFEHGLLGFPEAHAFGLVPVRVSGMFWLQSLEFEALSFLLADPFSFVDGYTVDLGGPELGDLLPERPSDLLVLSILTLPHAPDEAATANLQGPLALNLAQHRGRQIVLEDSPWGVRWPVELPRRKQTA